MLEWLVSLVGAARSAYHAPTKECSSRSSSLLLRLGKGSVLVTLIWLAYWYLFLRRKPRLYYLPTERNEKIVKACPSLFKPYSPTPYATFSHLQMVLYVLRGTVKVPWRREAVRLQDGGIITLDWALDDSDPNDFDEPKPKKTVVILHGLAGSSDDFGEFAQKALKEGYRVIVYNRRGHAKIALATSRLTNHGDAAELREILDYLTQRLPESPLFSIGVSAGSAVLVSYLGDAGSDSPLVAAAAVAPGYDMAEFLVGKQNRSRSPQGEKIRRSTSFDTRAHPLYDKVMFANWKGVLKQHMHHFKHVCTWEEIEACSNYTDYETKCHWKICGFPSFELYLETCNPLRDLKNFKIPWLSMSALDDPIFKPDLIYYDMFLENEAGLLVTTDFGSHTTYLTGTFSLSSWKDQVIIEYFNSVYDATCKNKELNRSTGTN